MRRTIHHLAVIWDESDHLSAKHSKRLSEQFWVGYLTAFPEGGKTRESPQLIVTGSPIFAIGKVRSFFHEGTQVPHVGKNKDLAIVKFCSTGFLDQDERYRFALNDLRELRLKSGQPPMHADSSAAVVFITSDWGAGMNEALDYVKSKSRSNRTTFLAIRLNKEIASGDRRVGNAGFMLGSELKKRFVTHESDALVLDLESD